MELLACLSRWLDDGSLGLGELTDDRLAGFLGDRRRGGGLGLVTAFGVAPLLGYLRGLGVVPPCSRALPAGPGAVLLERYRNYLVSERGVAPQGVVRYERVAELFARSVSVGDEVDWAAVSAGDVSRFRRQGVLVSGRVLGPQPGCCASLVAALRPRGRSDAFRVGEGCSVCGGLAGAITASLGCARRREAAA